MEIIEIEMAESAPLHNWLIDGSYMTQTPIYLGGGRITFPSLSATSSFRPGDVAVLEVADGWKPLHPGVPARYEGYKTFAIANWDAVKLPAAMASELSRLLMASRGDR